MDMELSHTTYGINQLPKDKWVPNSQLFYLVYKICVDVMELRWGHLETGRILHKKAGVLIGKEFWWHTSTAEEGQVYGEAEIWLMLI